MKPSVISLRAYTPFSRCSKEVPPRQARSVDTDRCEPHLVAPSRSLIAYVPYLLCLLVGIAHVLSRVILNKRELTSPRLARSSILWNRTDSSGEIINFHRICHFARSLCVHIRVTRQGAPQTLGTFLSEKGTAGKRDDEPCLVKWLLCAHRRPSLKQKF